MSLTNVPASAQTNCMADTTTDAADKLRTLADWQFEVQHQRLTDLHNRTIGWPRSFTLSLERVESPAPHQLPIPEKHAVAVQEQPDSDYLRLVEKLGIRSAAILTVKLEAILADEFIPVFDYEKVEQYLNNECLKRAQAQALAQAQDRLSYTSWCWKPVRAEDRKGTSGMPRVTRQLYQQAIPGEVLLTMERIAAKLPEAKFFVSEIVDVADPFLAVTVKGANKLWVIERWDEPSFRG